MKWLVRPIIMIPIASALACGFVSLPHNCPSPSGCRWLATDVADGAAFLRAIMLGLLAFVALWTVRMAALYRAVHTLRSALAGVAHGARLEEAMARTGVGKVRCVTDAPQPAFCWGWLRPEVMVTVGAVELLDSAALDAVLLHEDTHRRRRDPLRRALRLAACDVVVFAPVLRWWHQRISTREELRADARAGRRVGSPALARALLAVEGITSMPTVPMAMFGDASVPRVQQLLGEHPTLPRISRTAMAGSLGGISMATMVLMCLTQFPF